MFVINFFRKLRGKSYWSLAKFLEYKVKNAVKYIGEYERTVSDYAKRHVWLKLMTSILF